MYSFKIALPNECDLYEVFNRYADKIRLNQENSRILKITRDTLLPKLMSGEIRVTDLQN